MLAWPAENPARLSKPRLMHHLQLSSNGSKCFFSSRLARSIIYKTTRQNCSPTPSIVWSRVSQGATSRSSRLRTSWNHQNATCTQPDVIQTIVRSHMYKAGHNSSPSVTHGALRGAENQTLAKTHLFIHNVEQEQTTSWHEAQIPHWQ